MTLLVAQATDHDIDGVVGWVVDLMDRLGLFGAGLASGIDSVLPFIPSEVILPLVGFAAGRDVYSLPAALIAVTLGSLVGGLIDYALGRWFGRERTVWLFERLPLIKVEDFEKSEAWFARHGRKAVFFGRCVPAVRVLISVPAGIEKMNLLTFSLLTTAGSLLWNSIFVIGGYKLGADWHVVEPYVHWFTRLVIAGFAVALLAFVVVRLRSRTDLTGRE